MKKITLFFWLIAAIPVVTTAQINSKTLNINALSANVMSDGSLEETRTTIGSKSLCYSTQLWFTAKDVDDSLCVAAQMFRQFGVDFIAGPISTNPNAHAVYNRAWKINKTMVDSFVAGQFAGMVPPEIAMWPAHGNAAFGESFYLAPFVDVNNNGYYNPMIDGDYPCILADQAVFFVFNDDTVHTNTGAPSLGIEVLGMAYAYHDANFLDSVVFVQYTIRAKKKALKDVSVGTMADFDLGNPIDDIVGTFIDQNAVISYNADADDEGPVGFGLNPPATGLVVLSGISTSGPDGMDNDKDGCIDGVRDSNGNCQSINPTLGITESWRLSNSMYMNNTASNVSGNPSLPLDFANYLQSKWKPGFPLVIESPSGFMNTNNGDGFIPGGTGTPIAFMYPGNSYDTSGAFMPATPTNWFESPANLSDKRAIAGLGSRDTLMIGDEFHIKTAFFMARDANTINSYNAAHAMAVKINNHVETIPNCSGSRLVGIVESALPTFTMYPNPAQDWVTIAAPRFPNATGKIVGLDGRVLLTFQTDQSGHAAVGAGNLPNGVYVIRIGEKTERLLIQK